MTRLQSKKINTVPTVQLYCMTKSSRHDWLSYSRAKSKDYSTIDVLQQCFKPIRYLLILYILHRTHRLRHRLPVGTSAWQCNKTGALVSALAMLVQHGASLG